MAAVVVLKEAESLTEEELRLAKNKSPRFVHFASDLPKNAVGKVVRNEVRRYDGQLDPCPRRDRRALRATSARANVILMCKSFTLERAAGAARQER